MSKIASSKYKHAVPKSNRPEWYTDISVNIETAETSQVIKASRKFIAFPFGSTGGGAIGVVNLSETGGKFSRDMPVVTGHSGPISDLDFSPFDDHLLATGSDDTTIRLWKIPEGGLTSNLSDPLLVLKGHEKKVESVTFHTAASQVLASTSANDLKIWDLNAGTAKLSTAFPDTVFSASWKSDGSMLTTTCKDKKIRTIDPRTGSFAQEADGHTGVKASTSIWLGNLDQLLTTGFNKTREREFFLWDSRSLAKPLKTNQLDSSTGTLIPLYDEDSAMLFIGGKGDTSLRWFEVVHDKSPYFQWEGSPAVEKEQQKGLCLVPKLALNVNKCEVAQVLRLTQNAIVPLRFNVPRKTYSIFHDDLYPDTKWTVPGMTADEWFAGENKPVPTFPVDPSRRKAPTPAASTTTGTTSSAPAAAASTSAPASSSLAAASNTSNENILASSSASGISAGDSFSSLSQDNAKQPEVVAVKDLKYKFTGVRQSSYRYISGKPLHPSTNYDHIKDLSLKMSGECDALAVSSQFLAIPLNKPGGQIGIIPIAKMGRQPPKIPALVNGGEVLDFVFNPFDPSMLATACDDSYVRIWKIPAGGISEDTTEPAMKLSGHRHRVNLIRFHPTVKDILVTSSSELSEPSIKYWDLTTGKEVLSMTGFQDQVFSFDHNFDGSLLAVVSKDKMLRIFDSRSKKLIREGPSHEGTRGARVAWLGKTGRICTIGFDKGSQREIKVFAANDLSKPLATQVIDVSPSVLVPYFDEDTNVLFLWGRGDASTHFFEITEEKPIIHFLTKFDCSSLIFGQAFLPKWTLDVKGVEIAKSYILCQSHIETVSFTVPRTRLEYFQNDIFPPTHDLRQPLLEAAQWLGGASKEAPLLNLQPEGMKPVTEAPVEIKAKKYESRKDNVMSKEERDKAVLDNMFKNVREEAGSGPLKQDLKEGADESEWDD